MKKLSWMLVGLTPLLAPAAEGTWESLSFARARSETVPVDVPGAWTRLPPRDVDPKLSHVQDPIPRPWSGQKAALAFARLGVPPQAAHRA